MARRSATPARESAVMHHGQGHSVQLHRHFIRRSPIANIKRIAVAAHDGDGSEGRELVEQNRIADVPGVKDVIGRFDVRPDTGRERPSEPERVCV